MIDGKTISIIIPVYNTEAYFPRCIDSVLGQSYRNLEVIVVNDGSPGDIDRLMEPIVRRDSRVRYLRHEKNQGLFRARVTGMAAATGEYVAFLDSDDYVSYDFYRTLLQRSQETGADIVLGKTVWEENGQRKVFNLHESCFQFGILEGEQIREAYFSQEASCYSWHTVWNKLYHKSLVDRCFPVFDSIRDHIIMTEDICFSSVFLYEARRMAVAGEEAYFYCANDAASTNTSKITIQKFLKNMADIRRVFDSVDSFLLSRGATAQIRAHFSNARVHYARMWQNLLNGSFSGQEKKTGQAAIDAFCPEFTMDHSADEFFFESLSTPWQGVLEYFKEQIGKGEEKYISFDIFDTLILRPFYQPEDLFELLNPRFRQLTGSQTTFSGLRKTGEQLARQAHGRSHPEHQDITLSEIYRFIGEHYQLPEGVAEQMQQLEIQLELSFCEVRKAGKALFDMAKAAGKKVLLVTDMYLEQPTIEAILEKNGFTGYERLYVSCRERKLKYNGDLFRCVLWDYPDAAGSVIHIGDTWTSDIEGSAKADMRSLFLPKTRESFENKISDYRTNGCAGLADRICGSFIDGGKVKNNPGYRSMLAVASQRYFDRPYRPFHSESDLNADPYFIGYYLVGMHMMGLCKWIDGQVKATGRETIHFLSRDGYLPMKAYEIYRKYRGGDVKLSYLQTSRKALMPLIAGEPVSFYQLPIEFRAHTPESLLELLHFASAPLSREEKRRMLKAGGITPDQYMKDEDTYHQVIRFFLENIYSREVHRSSQALVERYFSQVKPGDIAFDMGYSGRIQAAICRACGAGIDVLFLHEDYSKSIQMRGAGDFDIRSLYDFRPSVSGLFREHLLSDCGGSCIGYRSAAHGVEPVIEQTVKRHSDSSIIRCIQQGALDFMEDYLSRFGDWLDVLDYSPIEVSLPLEGYMRHFSDMDIRIFGGSYFEDEVYGGRAELNIEQFIRNQTRQLDGDAAAATAPIAPDSLHDRTLREILSTKPPLIRAALWLFIDFDGFRQRVVSNLKRIFRKNK